MCIRDRNGFIPYFAGDAFTAVFPTDQTGNTSTHLINTAQALLAAFNPEEAIKTRFGDFHIGIKIGLSFGNVDWGIVGKEYKSFYFRGDAIDHCAIAQTKAKEQEIILDQSLSNQIQKEQHSLEAFDGKFYRLLNRHSNAPEISKPVITSRLREDVVPYFCLLYTSPSPRDATLSRMPSSA